MEHVIQLHIEKLLEGVYLATSNDVQGLIAQGRTIQETIEIARDVAKKLIESQAATNLPTAAESLDVPAHRRHLMGRLGGFRYRDITRRLKALGFVFQRQAHLPLLAALQRARSRG